MRMFNERMKARGQGGFTLIELLVVIAILAVLGGAVIIGIGAMRGNAQEQVCKTEKETIETAAEAYNTSEGSYPADVAALATANYLKSGSINPAQWTINATGTVTGQTKYPNLTVNVCEEP